MTHCGHSPGDIISTTRTNWCERCEEIAKMAEPTNCLFCEGEGCIFCEPPKHPWFNAKSASAQQRQNFNKGLHPMGARLADNGQQCDNCANHIAVSMGKTFHKCQLNRTGSAATDIRVNWPACELFVASGKVPF